MRRAAARAAAALAAAALGLAAALAAAGPPAPPGAPAAPGADDVASGQAIYERCGACHSLDRDRVGPRHCGLFGRRAGSVPGFAYSDAMRRSGIVWNRATLDRFVADPQGTVPGTFMGYAGVQDAKERAQLLAYLEVATRGDACRALAAGAGP